MCVRAKDGENGEKTDHERFEVWPPPLCEAIPDLPFVVDAVRDTELLRIPRGCKALVEAPLEPVDLIFTRLEVVTRSTGK
jgi:hypothetical protein